MKDRIGTGYWFRNNSELLLVGMKGTVPQPALDDQLPFVIHANRRAHSVKPDVFAEIVELIFPTLDKLEMFARGPRIGWTVWGNELGADRAPQARQGNLLMQNEELRGELVGLPPKT